MILVDDAGDNPSLCKSICDEFCVDYYRNSTWDGVGLPRNALQIALDKLKEDSTEFVLVSGADAYWLPNKLYQERTEIVKSPKIGAVYSNFLRADKNFTNHHACIRRYSGNRIPEGHNIYTVDKDTLLENCVVSDHALTRYECYDLIDYKYRTDVHRNFMWDLWLRISEKYEIKFVDAFASFYWLHGKNISLKWDYRSKKFDEYRKIVCNDARKRRGLK
jgi:hypothetical protein